MSIDEEFDINALAREYGAYYGIEQRENESGSAYRSRVAGELRRKDMLIEAHEAFSGRTHDDPAQGPTGPMTGILGAVSQIMQRTEYPSHNPERQIGDDIAEGVVQQGRNINNSALEATFDLLGPEDGAKFLNDLTKKRT